jgi:hypothetical protein
MRVCREVDGLASCAAILQGTLRACSHFVTETRFLQGLAIVLVRQLLQSACSESCAAVLYTHRHSVTEKCILQGLAIVLVGQLLQFTCHKHLAGLARTLQADQKQASTSAASTSGPRYVMPTGVPSVC